jgi:hypothetical protein
VPFFRVPTNRIPFGLNVIDRALGTFSAYSWILNPDGSVIFFSRRFVFRSATASEGSIKFNSRKKDKMIFIKGVVFMMTALFSVYMPWLLNHSFLQKINSRK